MFEMCPKCEKVYYGFRVEKINIYGEGPKYIDEKIPKRCLKCKVRLEWTGG